MNMLTHVRADARLATEKRNTPESVPFNGASTSSTERPQFTRTYRAEEVKVPPLGIVTKSASTFPPNDQTEQSRITESRALMWKLKAVVNGLLPGSRTSKCFRHMSGDYVGIHQNPDTKHCRYTKLRVCGRVWPCPICARRITEQRRKDLAQATDVARSQGETVLMVTQTFSHGLGDDLKESLAKLRKAQRYFTSGRAAENLRNKYQLDGTIRALELTFGRNGWHPHSHTLWFIKGDKINRLRLKRELFCLWWKACKKVGLKTSYKHGLDVSGNEKDVSTYIAKWGIETEMTKSNLKTGHKKDSVTPWGMLNHIAEGGAKSALYSAMFVVYAEAMHGHSQLYWSRGLRERLTVVDISDEDIAKEGIDEKPADIILAQLNINEWVPITRYNLESTLLQLAEAFPASIQEFVTTTQRRYLQERADKECDLKGVPRYVVPVPTSDTKAFTPRQKVNLADLADKDLDFSC